ncbi:nucleotide sugar dehydrogenase [Bacillus sp. OTU2372]|uniref:nucleotide sugar dehydrogenase n=1 Tax=Bacillus sp. OTU2372 TaxID=3043858 RepID=UPI00313E45D6
MKVCIVGLGYIGLPTAIIFAQSGFEVIGVDINPAVIQTLKEGRVPIEEPGLQTVYDEVRNKGTWKVSQTPEAADAFIIAVPTPFKKGETKECDLSYVKAALRSLLPYIQEGNLIIVESTIAPRSMEDEIKPVLENEGYVIGSTLFLAHCPERVLPGRILSELINNNRIIGGITPSCTERACQMYQTFVNGEIIKTDAKTAEMAKVMENTFRDVNIALANELSKICHELSINVYDVIRIANKHPRVNIHQPGPGVGGHCLAVDPYFIVSKSPQTAKLIGLSREINSTMPDYVTNIILHLMKEIEGSVITIFGLTYKGNIDDIRESPALSIYKKLMALETYEIRVYDPHVSMPFVEKDINKAVVNSDLIVVLTDHNEFIRLSGVKFSDMNHARVFDTKGIVEWVDETVELINFGNLFEFIKREGELQDGA